MRRLYSLAVVLLVALGAKAATAIAATCCGCPPCPLCKLGRGCNQWQPPAVAVHTVPS